MGYHQHKLRLRNLQGTVRTKSSEENCRQKQRQMPQKDLRASQAKAGYLLSLANQRKDCVACIGPHKADLVGVTNTTTQTDNLIKYFSTLMSTSYGVFDSGMKYTYDRFNNKFVLSQPMRTQRV